MLAPGPEMVMLSFTSNSPLVSVIVPLKAASKLIESPSFASASAWRNEPALLSFVFITVIVAAKAICTLETAAHSNVKKNGIRELILEPRFFIKPPFGVRCLTKEKNAERFRKNGFAGFVTLNR